MKEKLIIEARNRNLFSGALFGRPMITYMYLDVISYHIPILDMIVSVQVRTALGLVRRRVCGVIRGCQDRDLMGDGWVSAEGLFAVLKEQGILQQLG